MNPSNQNAKTSVGTWRIILWWTNLSEERKIFYRVATQLDPSAKMLFACSI
jgi:hypothetical protein